MSDERIRSINYWTGPITWQPLKGGLSNESFTVTQGGEKFVVRFGRDFPFHHVSRDREIMAGRAAHAAGFGPELVHCEPGAMILRYIDGETCDTARIRANIVPIARIVARFHTEMPGHVSGPGYIFWVFHVIRDYARTLKEGGSRLANSLPDYLELAREMEAAQVPMPIIYGHHDFLPANFIDDGARLWIIDYEYSGFSTPMFDLAGIAANASFDPDQTDLLLREYSGEKPDAAILRSHAAMQCASLLREAMWSMVSEIHLDAPGADYVAYTRENLDRLAIAVENYRSRFTRN